MAYDSYKLSTMQCHLKCESFPGLWVKRVSLKVLTSVRGIVWYCVCAYR